MPKYCEAPDHKHLRHPAYQSFGYRVVVYPRKIAWYFACKDHLEIMRQEIAMGRTQLRIMRWWGGKL